MKDYEGSITVRGNTLFGWAFNKSEPEKHLQIELFADDKPIGTVTANIYRQDLLKAGKGNGDHGFCFNLAGTVNRNCYISAKVAGTNYFLNNSPVFLSYSCSSERKKLDILKQKFCFRPFEQFVLGEGGNVHLCCPVYLPTVAGNAHTNTFEEIWNSDTAIAIRDSILDGSYRYCLDECPFIQKLSLPDKETIKESKYLDIIKSRKSRLDFGPTDLALLHDRSCNICCPSCRSERYIATGTEQESLKKIKNNFILPTLPFLKNLIFGGGEVFASKHLMEVITSIDKKKHPNLRIEIFTNGTLFNESSWLKIKNVHGLLKTVFVSLDASQKDTFEGIRRGAVFEQVWKNLEFISNLRKSGDIQKFGILFVVQARNFREMKDFVMLGKKLSCDYVGFSQLMREGIYSISSEQFEKQNIFSINHPDHREFLDLLKDPIFEDPIVDLKNLMHFRKGGTFNERV